MKIISGANKSGGENETNRYGASPVKIDTAEIKHSQTDTTERPVEISAQHIELYQSLYSDLAFFASGTELPNNPFEDVIKVILQDNPDMTRDGLKDPQKAKDALKRYVASIGGSETKLKGDRLMLLQNITNWKAMTLQLATGITLDTKYLRPQSSIASPGTSVHIKKGEMLVTASTRGVEPYKGRNPISKLKNHLGETREKVRDAYEAMRATYLGSNHRLKHLFEAISTASQVSADTDAIFHINSPYKNVNLKLKKEQLNDTEEERTVSPGTVFTDAQIKLIQHTFGYTKEGSGNGNDSPIITDELLAPIIQYILLATEARRNLYVQTGGRNQDFDPNLIIKIDGKYKPRNAVERHYLQDTSYSTETPVDTQIVDQAKQISDRLIADIKKKAEKERERTQEDINKTSTIATITAQLSEIDSVGKNPPEADKRRQDQEKLNLQIQISSLTKLRDWLKLGGEDGGATREAQLKKKGQLEAEKTKLTADVDAYNTAHKDDTADFDVRNFANATHESSIAKDRISLAELEGQRDRIQSYATSLENDRNNLTNRLTAIYAALGGNLGRSTKLEASVAISSLTDELNAYNTKDQQLQDKISDLRKKLNGNETEDGLFQQIVKSKAQIRSKETHVEALRSQFDRINVIDAELAQINRTQANFQTEYRAYYTAQKDDDPESWNTDNLYADIADLERRLSEVGKDPDLERKSLVLTELKRLLEATGQDDTRNRAMRASRGELQFVADRRYTTEKGVGYPWPYLRVAQIFMGDEVLLPGKANADRLAVFAKVFPPEQFFNNAEVRTALGLNAVHDTLDTQLRMMDDNYASRRDTFDKSIEKVVSSLLKEASQSVRTSESFGQISIPDEQSDLWKKYDTITIDNAVESALSDANNQVEVAKLTYMFYYYESPRHLATLVHRYLGADNGHTLRTLGGKDFSKPDDANIISKQVAMAIDATRQRMMSIAN